jgi:diacylglycerol O-acyltransferase
VHRVAAPVAGQGASLLFALMVTSIPVPASASRLMALSYQDTAYIALHADREALPDVQRLAEAMQTAVIALNDLVE